jgi:hypothetical protein
VSTGREIFQMIQDVMEPYVRNMRLMVSRVVADIVIDITGIQTVQASALFGEVAEFERMQDYGFTSVPFSQSAEGVAVYAGGNREHGIIVKMDDRTFRKRGLLPGDVAVYHWSGSFLYFNGTGMGDLFAPLGLKLGNTLVTEPAIKGTTFQGVYNSHIHVGNLGFLTAPPSVPSTPADLSLSVMIGL